MTFFNRKKGATVAEMIVVIAVLSIISTIVVSFMVVSNEKVRTSNDKMNAISDIAVIESKVNNWVNEKLKKEYIFTLVHGGNYMNLKVTKEDETNHYILSFSDNQLSVSTYNGITLVDKEILYNSSVVSQLNFIVSEHDSKVQPQKKEWLIICQVTYKVQKSRKNILTYNYAFAMSNYNILVANGAKQGVLYE